MDKIEFYSPEFHCHFFQSHSQVQQLLDNLREGELFCDPDFPADNMSLFYSLEKQAAERTIIWKRPKVLMLVHLFILND